MTKTRILILILCISMLAGLFASCNQTETPETTEPETTALPETEPAPTTAVLFDMDAMHYTLVRGTYAGTVAIDAVKDIVAAFRERSAGEWTTSITEDFVKGQKRDDVFEIEGKEILVGITNRKESQDVYATLKIFSYSPPISSGVSDLAQGMGP